MRCPTRPIVGRGRRLLVDGYDLDPLSFDTDETSDEPWCYRSPRRRGRRA